MVSSYMSVKKAVEVWWSLDWMSDSGVVMGTTLVRGWTTRRPSAFSGHTHA